MFKFKPGDKKERAVVATTKDELNAALKRKDPYIEVDGKLAKSLKWIVKLSPVKIGALITALGGLTVASGGMAAPAALSVISAVTGGEIAAIIAASGIAISTIIAVLKGYDAEYQKPDGSVLILKRKN